MYLYTGDLQQKLKDMKGIEENIWMRGEIRRDWKYEQG